jgi:hypothetical protein
VLAGALSFPACAAFKPRPTDARTYGAGTSFSLGPLTLGVQVGATVTPSEVAVLLESAGAFLAAHPEIASVEISVRGQPVTVTFRRVPGGAREDPGTRTAPPGVQPLRPIQ